MAKSSNDDIKQALREALTSGLGDFLLQEPASSEGAAERSRNNNQPSDSNSGNSQSQNEGSENSNRGNRSIGPRTAARSTRGNSRLLELFRQRLLSRLGADDQRSAGRSRSRKARRS